MVWLQTQLQVRAPVTGLHLITDAVRAAVPQIRGVQVGLLHLFLQHSSAGLAINENADPDVRADLNDWLRRVAPDADPRYRHQEEGPDDMSAHIKSALTGVSLSVPVRGGGLALGAWQGVYLCEFRASPPLRTIVLTLVGAAGAAVD